VIVPRYLSFDIRAYLSHSLTGASCPLLAKQEEKLGLGTSRQPGASLRRILQRSDAPHTSLLLTSLTLPKRPADESDYIATDDCRFDSLHPVVLAFGLATFPLLDHFNLTSILRRPIIERCPTITTNLGGRSRPVAEGPETAMQMIRDMGEMHPAATLVALSDVAIALPPSMKK
jgi:hypothetical protein